MEFEHSYAGASVVANTESSTGVRLSPDLRREPTFFKGELAEPLPFREAISALHDVVVADLRFHPKDHERYKAWAAERDERDLEQLAAQAAETKAQVERLRVELQELQRRSHKRSAAYLDARQRYFNHLFLKDRDAWFVFDPVITVHPDEIFFECFSQDESTYGRLSVDYQVFRNLGEHAYGTTNVDYSAALYDELQKIRSYKTTSLDVDPRGFQVDTSGEPTYKEVKIDLPDSWVRGFLQVSSAMTFPAVRFSLHPYDIHNICFVLSRHREVLGPRSLRFILEPQRPLRILFEPWGFTLECPRSRYEGTTSQEIRIWGRRRLLVLERLIPIAKRFEVLLLGSGMPSFFLADLGPMTFTLGLSGWTANDWSRAGNFDLLAPRREVDDLTRRKVFAALRQRWLATPDELATELGLARSAVLGSLQAYTQAGRVIYDLHKQVYRLRELSREPIPLETLRFANPREEEASRFLEQDAVRCQGVDEAGVFRQVRGRVRHGQRDQDVVLVIDRDERLVNASCTCNYHAQHRLFNGPCEHILALRAHWESQRRKN